MELAWLADEEPAIAIVADNDICTKLATTSAIDSKQMFRTMIRFPLQGRPQNCSIPGSKRLFNDLTRPHAVYRQLWPLGYSANKEGMRLQDCLFPNWGCTESPILQGDF